MKRKFSLSRQIDLHGFDMAGWDVDRDTGHWSGRAQWLLSLRPEETCVRRIVQLPYAVLECEAGPGWGDDGEDDPAIRFVKINIHPSREMKIDICQKHGVMQCLREFANPATGPVRIDDGCDEAFASLVWVMPKDRGAQWERAADWFAEIVSNGGLETAVAVGMMKGQCGQDARRKPVRRSANSAAESRGRRRVNHPVEDRPEAGA
jgi:hypothetical protein